MEITEWYTIKALSLPSSWIAFLSSMLIVGLLLWKVYRKEVASIYADAVLTLILVWKFSVIVTDFSIVIKHPLTILYFNGGMIGFVIGMLFMLATLWKKLRSRGILEEDLQALFLSSILCQSFYQIMMAILNDAFLWQKGLTIISFSCWIVIAFWKRNEGIIWHRQLLILFFFSHMLIASLQPLGIWQLSVLVTLLFIIFRILVQPRRNKS
ncbi:hypothetical protein CW357_03475 [Rummeliibacillus sp. TYF005]|uniref:hypothetical protein n=1 Tax=unclassified Rummeliibacillus TaxID=2622809 RepID=UPI000E66EDC9|nr:MULTISPECIES: hypothetical protein [unclassified Rummeliibacillus]RIJ63772.1 hypothetical protein D1606_13220 [Rummeliibacillus sp. POC4]RPJ96852.1 hypothetical protein CW357_03475 [Rummeliibacillus sp. TYF005]